MPLDNGDIELFSTTLHENLDPTGTAREVVYDRSSEVSGGGDSLSVDDFSTAISIGDIADNSTADITYQDADDNRVPLDLDKRRFYGVKLPDSAVIEKFYDVQVSLAGQTARAIVNDIDKYLLAKHVADIPAAEGTEAQGAQKTTLALGTVGGTGSDPEWNTAAARAAIVEALVDRHTQAGREGWPEGRYVWMSPEMWGQLVKYLTVDAKVFGTGQMNDVAFARGAIGQTIGWTPYTNINIPAAVDAGTGKQPMYFGITGNTLHFAQQYSMNEVMRAQDFFGYLIRGAVRYGAVVRENARRMEMDFTLASS